MQQVLYFMSKQADKMSLAAVVIMIGILGLAAAAHRPLAAAVLYALDTDRAFRCITRR